MGKILALVLLSCGLAAALGASPENPKGHASGISGTVARIDGAAKTFAVRNAAGKETTLVRTGATKVNGQTLRVGDRVAVRWLDREGKKVATSIRIEPAAAAAAPTAPAATAP